MFVIPNNLLNKRKKNLILLQNKELYLIVQFVTQKCIGQKTRHKRSETANIAELNNETEDNPEHITEEANIVIMIADDTKNTN